VNDQRVTSTERGATLDGTTIGDRSATIERVTAAGLCMQCGTCAGICPRAAITMSWGIRSGCLPLVAHSRCDACGDCVAVCPGEGFDYTPDAWWRTLNGDAPWQDFLGPWKGLWFGWATDEEVRYAGASGGVASAILRGAFERDLIDAAAVVRMDPARPLAADATIARSVDEILAGRGSKYNAVAINTLLRRILREPGRYAVVGLPCHIQGLRLAQRYLPALAERIAFTLGVFCGWTALPRATEVAARRAGVDPAELTAVAYRGPDWPGGLRLVTRSGSIVSRPYPEYFDRYVGAYTPPRCRLCPDALAEAADISVGDAWLDRFAGTAGVSDVIARTDVGLGIIDGLATDHLTLDVATPEEIVASQRETYHFKRDIYRGRRWLRSLTGRPLPDYPGVGATASGRDRLAGLKDLVDERVHRLVGDLRYR
jgi:coenzyme F420 hydrogenase subunit beta